MTLSRWPRDSWAHFVTISATVSAMWCSADCSTKNMHRHTTPLFFRRLVADAAHGAFAQTNAVIPDASIVKQPEKLLRPRIGSVHPEEYCATPPAVRPAVQFRLRRQALHLHDRPARSRHLGSPRSRMVGAFSVTRPAVEFTAAVAELYWNDGGSRDILVTIALQNRLVAQFRHQWVRASTARVRRLANNTR